METGLTADSSIGIKLRQHWIIQSWWNLAWKTCRSPWTHLRIVARRIFIRKRHNIHWKVAFQAVIFPSCPLLHDHFIHSILYSLELYNSNSRAKILLLSVFVVCYGSPTWMPCLLCSSSVLVLLYRAEQCQTLPACWFLVRINCYQNIPRFAPIGRRKSGKLIWRPIQKVWIEHPQCFSLVYNICLSCREKIWY